jgi:excisionase family DNA binding protein
VQDINQMPDLLTSKQVSDYLQLSYKTILKLIRRGKITITETGCRGYRIHKVDLCQYLGYYNG